MTPEIIDFVSLIQLKAPWGGITAALLFWTIAKAFNALGALGVLDVLGVLGVLGVLVVLCVLGVLSVLAYCIVAIDKRINQNL